MLLLQQTEKKLDQKGIGKEVHLVPLRLGNAIVNYPLVLPPTWFTGGGCESAQTLGVGSTGLDHLSYPTHQIGKDVVVTNAVLLQLHNLKDRKGGDSSVTPTPTERRAVITAGDISWLFTTCPSSLS